MATNGGGDTDKRCNIYEIDFIVSKYIEMLFENGENYIKYVKLESYDPDEEKGTDVIVETKDSKVFYQCKYRKPTNAPWTVSELEQIIKKALDHMIRGYDFFLVSPYGTVLSDLSNLAKAFDTLDEYYNCCLKEKHPQNKIIYDNLYALIKKLLKNENNTDDNIKKLLWQILLHFKTLPFNNNEDSLKRSLMFFGVKNYDVAYSVLYTYSLLHLGECINKTILLNSLKKENIEFVQLNKENSLISINELKEKFTNSIQRELVNGIMYKRNETIEVLDNIKDNMSVVIHGESGTGKTGVAYEICKNLDENNICYLPINLNIYMPHGTTYQYGEQLGLKSSPVDILRNCAGNEKGVLILDQLDSIRWNNCNNDAFDCCCQLIKEIKSYDNLSVIVISRTVDSERLKNIFYIDDKNYDKLKVIQVNKIDNSLLEDILSQNKIDHLEPNLKKILSNFQVLNLYLTLKEREGIDNITMIYKRYLDQKIQEMSYFLLTKCEAEAYLMQIKEIFKISAAVALSLELIGDSINKTVIEQFVSVGVLRVENNNVSFSHQSILDYLLAKELFEKMNKSKLNIQIFNWKLNQSLEDYEIIKQFLEILKIRDFERYIRIIKYLLFSFNVRYFIKKAAIMSLSSINQSSISLYKLYLKIIFSKDYGIKFLFLMNGNKGFFQHLKDNNILNRITNKIKTSEELNIPIVYYMSIYDKINSVEIDKELINLHHKFDTKEWKYNFVRAIDVAKISEDLFNYILKNLSEGDACDISLRVEEIITNNNKLLSYLQYKVLYISNNTYFYVDTERYKSQIQNFISAKHQEVYELTSKYIFASLNDYELNYKSDFSENYNECFKKFMEFCYKESLLNINIEILMSNITYPFALIRNLSLQALVLRDDYISNELFTYINSNHIISTYDFQYERKAIWTFFDLIVKNIKTLDEDNINKLKHQIINYVSSRRLDLAKERFNQRTLVYYYPFFEDEQNVLFKAIPEHFLTNQEKDYLKYLNRKFKDSRYYNRHSLNSECGGVRCIISDKIDLLTYNNWLKIIKNPKIENGNFTESNLRSFRDAFVQAVSNNQNKFVNLVDVIDKDNLFVIQLCDGMSYGKKNANSNSRISAQNFASDYDRLKVFKKYYNIYSKDYLTHFITFLESLDTLDSWCVEKLEEIIFNSDKYEKEIMNLCPINWDEKFESLTPYDILTEEINRIQTRAINIFSSQMYNGGNIEKGLEILELLLKSSHPTILRSAMHIIYPLAKYNLKTSIDAFKRMVDKDVRTFYHIPSNYVSYAIQRDRRNIILTLLKDIMTKECDIEIKDIAMQNIVLHYLFEGKEKVFLHTVLCQGFTTNSTVNICNDIITSEHSEEQKIRAKNLLQFCIENNSLKTIEDTHILFYNNYYYEHDIELLIKILKKTKAYKINNTELYSIDKILSEKDKITDCKDLIFTLCEIFLNDKFESMYDEDKLILILVRLYGEFDNKKNKTPQKCLKYIDKIFKKYSNANLV